MLQSALRNRKYDLSLNWPRVSAQSVLLTSGFEFRV